MIDMLKRVLTDIFGGILLVFQRKIYPIIINASYITYYLLDS